MKRPGFAARRANKFGAVRTEVDGISFASKREAARYNDLKLLQRAGEISGLELQKAFKLEVNGVQVCRYVSDFAYRDKSGALVVEDAKGVPTPVFTLKAKLMKACHGIEVVTV